MIIGLGLWLILTVVLGPAWMSGPWILLLFGSFLLGSGITSALEGNR